MPFRPSAKYDRVDWSRSNADIARELRVNRSTVTRARELYAPGTSGQSRSGRPAWVPPPGIDWSKSTRILAARHHVSESCIYNHRPRP